MQRLQADYRPRSDDTRRIRGRVSRAVDDPARLQSAAPGARRPAAPGKKHAKTGANRSSNRPARVFPESRPPISACAPAKTAFPTSAETARRRTRRQWSARRVCRVNCLTTAIPAMPARRSKNAIQRRLRASTKGSVPGRMGRMTLFDLSGRVAIVTGGNGGIGLGMAQRPRRRRRPVVLAARDRPKAEKALAELAAAGARCAFIPLDVADESSCRAASQPTTRPLWPARHPGQQRRHLDPQAAAGVFRGRVAQRCSTPISPAPFSARRRPIRR